MPLPTAGAEEQKPPLKPMVPQFRPGEITKAWELIGQKEQYIVQLQIEMMERANIANDLDDDNIRMKALLPVYETELATLRERCATLELELRHATGLAGAKKPRKRKGG